MNEAPPEIFSFGMWVRRRRKALDLTQAAFAQRVGCAEVTIRKLETDVFRPSREMAERLATCLDVSADERPAFLQTARGERSVDRLPTPLQLIEPARPDPGSTSVPVTIPRDTLPAPAPLPAGSRMPLSRNPLFVGRERDLRQLASALQVGSTAAIGQVEIAAATGLGGIGKTQLACEFVHRYGQFFPGGVFWLSFADPVAVPAEVATCGGADGMQLRPAFGTVPLDEQVKLVLAAWESPTARLLIFDNCEDEALLAQWRPKHGGCHVLVTSRRHHWDAALGVQTVPLDVLARTDSLALLRSFRPDRAGDDADLDAVAAALGDLPLALHLAGSFLAKYRHALTPAQYLQRLHAPTILDDRSLRAAGLSPTQHVQHVARTFEQSYARLDVAEPIDALALTLLAHAAYFAPGERLPRWLLLATRALPDDAVEGGLIVEDALMRLIDLGLLEIDATGDLRLHRLLVAFVQTVQEDETAQTVVEATMLRVANALNAQLNPHALLVVQPHLRWITEAAHQRADLRAGALCHALGEHVGQLAVYPEAQRHLEQAVVIRQRLLGGDHPDLARSLDRLSGTLWAQGHYAAAQGYLEQALAIWQRAVGNDHPDTARSLNHLGNVLNGQGHYAAAQGYLEQALAIYQRVRGLDHPDTAWNLNNLGSALHFQGKYAAAQGSLERAVAIYQGVPSSDPVNFAWSLNNLGLVFYEQGMYATAQGYFEQAVMLGERELAFRYPIKTYSLINLGLVFYEQGMYTAAQGSLERAAAICEQELAPDHLLTALCVRGLGKLRYARGEMVQARRDLTRALTILEQRLGPQHPRTVQTRHLLTTLGATVPGGWS